MTRASPPRRALASNRGTSLVEVLIAIGLLGLLMSAAYGSLVAQMRTHATQMMVAETMNAGRSAMSILTQQVGLAGFGVPAANNPSPAPTFVAAERSRLSFWANVSTAHTFVAAAALENGREVDVVSAAGLQKGDSIYISDSDVWYIGAIESVSGNRLRLASPLSANFVAGSLVTEIEQVTFEVVDRQLRRNGRPLASGVTGLAFTYDAKSLEAIRVVGIRLQVETRDIDPGTGRRVSLSLAAEVAPPNLAL
jgi:prepilin-type N-terminal cleavage/methylation domain-containing protein